MFDKGFAAGPDAAASDEPAAGPVDAPGRVEAMLSALQHLGHVGVGIWISPPEQCGGPTASTPFTDILRILSLPASIGWWRTHILVTERRSPNNYTRTDHEWPRAGCHQRGGAS